MVYLCYHKCVDEEDVIRSQGYMRPGQRDLRLSDYEVEIPESSPSDSDSPDNSPFNSPTNSRIADQEVVDFLS
eukprot:scaffold45879_cov79-Cyclotella_meneghiniana.AAC.1